MLVEKYFQVVRRGSPVTDTFIIRYEYLPNKGLYVTKRMVHITEEGPKEYLFKFERPPLDLYIASEVLPPEEGVDRFRDKEYQYTPLPILSSGSRGITVTEAEISTIFCEGIVVNYKNNPSPDNSMQSNYVLPNSSSITFGFNDIYC